MIRGSSHFNRRAFAFRICGKLCHNAIVSGMSIHTHRWSNSKGRYPHCNPRRVEVTYRPSIGTDPLLYVAVASFRCWFVITSTSPSVCRLRKKGPVRTSSFASTPKINCSPLSHHFSIPFQRLIVNMSLGHQSSLCCWK